MPRQPYLCGLDAAVDVVGGKWKALILWALGDGAPHRFGELKRQVPGVSEKMLIQQLRELEADEVVHREVYHQVPPKVEYSLTDLGLSLNQALAPLGEWGARHKSFIEATRTAAEAATEAATETAAH
ncbi:transcriptional regulator [Spongiactinospora gelatinilytica]|uniref:Transcriptional regulator n=1 Tax=Spongiactinospora gelatinilytica TaxID=2666298 RepID=A0A2W2G8C3_9ACTN|nr:helix-turn-helix domain-containing protein [Spongiactinospora gelatinilytica]PZG30517.1 transcriptional regulator [Spongiactinospora gelatinilytica]